MYANLSMPETPPGVIVHHFPQIHATPSRSNSLRSPGPDDTAQFSNAWDACEHPQMAFWTTEAADASRRTIRSEFFRRRVPVLDVVSQGPEHTDRFQFRSEELRRNSGRQRKLDERSTAHDNYCISGVGNCSLQHQSESGQPFKCPG